MSLSVVVMLFLAQSQGPTPTPKQPKIQVVDIADGELFEGEAAQPAALLIDSRQPRRFESLIRVRADFNDKVRESVNEM